MEQNNHSPNVVVIRPRPISGVEDSSDPGSEHPSKIDGITPTLAGSAYSEAGRAVVSYALGFQPGPIRCDGDRFHSDSWKHRILYSPWPSNDLDTVQASFMYWFPDLQAGITLAFAGPVARVVTGQQTIPADWWDAVRNRIIPEEISHLAVPSIPMALFGEELTLALHCGARKFCPDVLEAMRHLKAAESTVRHLFEFEDVRIASSYLASSLLKHKPDKEFLMSTGDVLGLLENCIPSPPQFGPNTQLRGPWLWQ